MNKTILHFLRHLLIYLATGLGLLHLYYPFTENPDNRSNSTIQFVYQQF
ncbi:MAG TPA: hypothetical protein VI731_02165 [Bacteroidia bacterium]|nr:hypothetical protein [Bacteroidia bacterium]